MVKTCSLVHCRTGYKRKNGDGGEITKFPVFGFPNDKKYSITRVFLHGNDCKLQKKSALENFPAYITNYTLLLRM